MTTKLEHVVLRLALDELGRKRSAAVTLADLHSRASWLTPAQIRWALLTLADRGVIEYIPPLDDGLEAIVARPVSVRVQELAG